MANFILIFFAAIAVSLGNGVQAQDLDPHAIYESKCSKCHAPHAGPFARDRLSAKDGRVVSTKTGRRVGELLTDHFGTNLSPAEIGVLLEAFTLQLESGGIYQRKCIVCHERAKVFSRAKLTIDRGQLVGRYSGRKTASFLAHHGRLREDEIEVIVKMLRWQLETAKR